MRTLGRRQKGLSLIELLVALVVAAIVIAGVYRTFAVQQKNFIVQEQVSEAQQSVRAVMDMIARDIRMAGFGRPEWVVTGFPNTVTITSTSPANFTLVGVFSSPIGKLSNPATMGQNQITLDTSVVLNGQDNLLIFESGTSAPPLAPPLRYTTVVVWTPTGPGGATTIDIDADGATPGNRDTLRVDLRTDALVYRVEPVTYALNGNTLTRNGDLLATNVQNFQITDLYNPGPPQVPETFGSYQIVLTVATRTNDPDFPGGVRMRTLTSTLKARNMSLL